MFIAGQLPDQLDDSSTLNPSCGQSSGCFSPLPIPSTQSPCLSSFRSCIYRSLSVGRSVGMQVEVVDGIFVKVRVNERGGGACCLVQEWIYQRASTTIDKGISSSK